MIYYVQPGHCFHDDRIVDTMNDFNENRPSKPELQARVTDRSMYRSILILKKSIFAKKENLLENHSLLVDTRLILR